MAAAQWPHSGLRSDFVWKTKWKANLSENLAAPDRRGSCVADGLGPLEGTNTKGKATVAASPVAADPTDSRIGPSHCHLVFA